MNLFLASNIGGVKKENGKKIPIKFFEDNKFLENLKKSINQNRKFVLVASDPNSFEKNDLFLQMDIEALKLSGISFENYLVLDNRSKKNVKEVLKDSDLIFLCGGDTLTQNTFFNEINLKKYLKENDSTIVGISAGSINLASNVYNSPEDAEDLNKPSYLNGLELTNINIIPHFNLNDFNDENNKLQNNAILEESCKRTLIALVDGSYIYINDKDCKLYGESYEIKDMTITKICNQESVENLNDK